MILILAQEDDPHADAVLWYIERAGAKALRFDPERFAELGGGLICRPDLGRAALLWRGILPPLLF